MENDKEREESYVRKPLICDTCREEIKETGRGMVSWLHNYPEPEELTSFRLTHKGKCDINKRESLKSRGRLLSAWEELEDLLSPFGFFNFFFNLLQKWDRGDKLLDYEGLSRILLRLGPYVFREADANETERFKLISELLVPYNGSRG